jgi:hypothetical protein
LDFRLYWPSNQHAVRTVTAINSVQATGVMAIKWLILERPVGYGVVPPNVPERIKEMGAAHMFASRHAPTYDPSLLGEVRENSFQRWSEQLDRTDKCDADLFPVWRIA